MLLIYSSLNYSRATLILASNLKDMNKLPFN